MGAEISLSSEVMRKIGGLEHKSEHSSCRMRANQSVLEMVARAQVIDSE